MEVYANAPISEAALDIRVRVGRRLTDEELLDVKDTQYPEKYGRPAVLEIKLEANAENPAASATSLTSTVGFAYRSLDHLNVFQVRPDGFTHNRLAPYQEWDHFVREARRLWQVYKNALQPDVIELLGLNYVNHIEIPLKSDLKEYLRTYIEVPTGISPQLNIFAMSYQVDIPGKAGLLHISQSVGPPRQEGYATIILNIQAFRQVAVTSDQDDSEIWADFEILRKAKSDAFEACITDKVREMIR